MRCAQRLLGIAIAIGAGSASAGVQILEHTLHLLDVPPPITEQAGSARAINSKGEIIGWFPAGALDATNPLAFRALPKVNNGMVAGYTVERFPSSGSFNWVQPYDLNDRVIVGQARVNTQQARYAFGSSTPGTDLPSGVPNRLLRDPTFWDGSEATAINASGVVAGWVDPKGGTRKRAVFWDGGGPKYIFPDARESSALSINDAGLITGYYVNQTGPGNNTRGFIYDIHTGQVTELGPIFVQSSDTDTASNWRSEFRVASINAAGRVAATHPRKPEGGNPYSAFLFTEGGKRIELGTIGEFEESFAAGISDTDWVVGFLVDADKKRANTGFLWAAGQMFDLTALLSNADRAAGWTVIMAVHDAYSVVDPTNPLVQMGTIVGEGMFNGRQRALAMQITLQVPEPHVYLMLGVGLVVIGALRLRRLHGPG